MSDFIQFWQHLPSKMNPEIISLGPLKVQWYGLMYVLAFLVTYFIAKNRIKNESRFSGYSLDFVKDLMTYGFIGVLAGGRIGYVLFYNLEHYLKKPWEILIPFDLSNGMQFTGISGMSYHGGLIGVVIACALYIRKQKLDFWNLCDLFFPAAPLGYTLGRLGNFINNELYGRVTDSAVGMYFKTAPDQLRHASQLYEAFSEGILTFIILWSIRKIKMPKGAMLSAYVFSYGFFRFFVEFYREPDDHLGFVFLDYFSRGQILCFAQMAVAIGFFIFLWKREKSAKAATSP